MVWINYSGDNNSISGVTCNLKNQLEIHITWFNKREAEGIVYMGEFYFRFHEFRINGT